MATVMEIRKALAHEIDTWGGQLPAEVSVPGLFLVDVFNKLTQADSWSAWIRSAARVPDADRPVLAVKQLKNGRREICIARCILDYKHYNIETKDYTVGPYWVCGGNNNIIAWMELPEIPVEGG